MNRRHFLMTALAAPLVAQQRTRKALAVEEFVENDGGRMGHSALSRLVRDQFIRAVLNDVMFDISDASGIRLKAAVIAHEPWRVDHMPEANWFVPRKNIFTHWRQRVDLEYAVSFPGGERRPVVGTVSGFAEVRIADRPAGPDDDCIRCAALHGVTKLIVRLREITQEERPGERAKEMSIFFRGLR